MPAGRLDLLTATDCGIGAFGRGENPCDVIRWRLNVDEVRDRISAVLARDDRVVFAVLFGSRASGGGRPDSDWDVAIYLDEDLDGAARFDCRRELLAAFVGALDVDLVVLNDAPALLAARALAGERLFVRDPSTFVRFFVKTLAMADDDRHFGRIHTEARRRRLREGQFGRPRDL